MKQHSRKLFAFNMMSMDGCFEGPDHDISWHQVDEEFNQFAIEQTSAAGAILFGRVTYELMAGFWPTPAAKRDDPTVADLMNRLPKIVVSSTLQKTEWENTRLINDNIEAEITALKQQPGKDLAVFGSATLLSFLIEKNLVDEHRIMINPVVLGAGTPLFKDIESPLHLKFVKTRTFRSGNILLIYQAANGNERSESSTTLPA